MAVMAVVGLDADNIEAVLAVSSAPGQEAYVRPVAWYVSLAAYEHIWTPVALQLGDEVVGFAQWAYDPQDGTYTIGGVVIDAARQGQGLGRLAMGALIDALRQHADCGPIALSVHADNERARALYAALGFAETGEELDGELVMVLPAGPGMKREAGD